MRRIENESEIWQFEEEMVVFYLKIFESKKNIKKK